VHHMFRCELAHKEYFFLSPPEPQPYIKELALA
jgi:hypothetical protein